MLELTAAQSLIARITGIGLASAVFTYYLVKLLVKPFIDVRLAGSPYREFATNAATAVIVAAVANFGHESIRNYGRPTPHNLPIIDGVPNETFPYSFASQRPDAAALPDHHGQDGGAVTA